MTVHERFRFVQRDTGSWRARLENEIRLGLAQTPKRLPCCLFYDREGSKLFEEICKLPEYYLTRAEREILELHANELPLHIDAPATIVELGSGNSEKTRLILAAFLATQPRLDYVAVDICSEVLRETATSLLAEYHRLHLTAVAAEYRDALALVGASEGPPRLVLWLGSNIGNFHPQEAVSFVSDVVATLRPQDRVLIGVDRRKDRATLEAAYDDAAGVTAAFNLNMLQRVNRDFDARFDLSKFRHLARWDEASGRVEMHLVARKAQRVAIPGLELEIDLAEGESIHTENSYKYTDDEINQLLDGAGLEPQAWWTDAVERYRLVLARPGSSS